MSSTSTSRAARTPSVLHGVAAALCLSALLLPLHGSAQGIVPQSPLPWQENRPFPTDANRNKVEDSLDALGTRKANVILCLKGCPTPADLVFFSTYGTIGYQGKYLTLVAMKNVGRTGISALRGHKLVYEIVNDVEVQTTLDVSVAAIRVRPSADYSPNTVEERFPGVNGTGVNIAILDTGVDDGVHSSLPAAKFVGGYNAITGQEGNPDDDFGHGTHVAGIALGVSPVHRGVAPGAGLVDVKVLDANGRGSTSQIIAGIDRCIQRKTQWKIGVINMSLGAAIRSNGTDPMALAVNRAVAAGIVVVVSAGNSGPNPMTLGTPGTADDAITVAASDDRGTVNRNDDTIAPFSSRGPRLSDGDQDQEDEQKPDVTAPGVAITAPRADTANGLTSLSGTSMAAPHVAGLAALVLQMAPGMPPLAVKRLLRGSAEDRGAAGWDPDWGAGLINAHETLLTLSAAARTDLRFDVYCFGPSPNWWASPNILLRNAFIQEGVLNGVSAELRNAGPNPASSFQVKLYVHDFGNSDPDYHIATLSVALLEPGATLRLPMTNWLPVVSGTGVQHRCIKAEIVYPFDSDQSNNCAQRNVDIRNSNSPAVFRAAVGNPFDEDVLVKFEADIQGDPGFALEGVPLAGVIVEPGCPMPLDFQLNPVGTVRGSATANIRMFTELNGIRYDLGGVTAVAQIPNYKTVACLDDFISNGQRSEIFWQLKGLGTLTGKYVAEDAEAISGTLWGQNFDTGVKIRAVTITSIHVERFAVGTDKVIFGEGFGLVNEVPTEITFRVTRFGNLTVGAVRDKATGTLLLGGETTVTPDLFTVEIRP